MRSLQLIACVLALGLVAGCAAYREIPPAKKQEIGGVFRVEPASSWSSRKTGQGEIWTVNGFGLERMAFITNVTDGSPLLSQNQGKDAPTFHKNMTATDVVDLYEAMLTSNGYSQIEVTNLRPHSVSGQDAFRFDYNAFDNKGLAKRGMVVALIDGDKGLNLVLYEAAAEHYYEAYRTDAESVLASLEKI
jgi:hypothetical protein